MVCTSGERLYHLQPPSLKRGSQFVSLMEHLNMRGPESQKVCVLYGMPGTGRTTLLHQAIHDLLRQGISPQSIAYIAGKPSDHFDELHVELQDNLQQYRYIFIDDIDRFANFLLDGSFLYDTLVRVYNCKVVIAESLPAIYTAMKRTLYDRCLLIRVPHLRFHEHCELVLKRQNPTMTDLLEYARHGGLFDPSRTAGEAVGRLSMQLAELFQTQPQREIAAWMPPDFDGTDWTACVDAVLHLTCLRLEGAVPGNGILQDIAPPDSPAFRQIAHDVGQYFSSSKWERTYSMAPTVTTALLDLLLHSGVITDIPVAAAASERRGCCVAMPLLRRHSAEKLSGQPMSTQSLLESLLVCEYRESNPGSDLCLVSEKGGRFLLDRSRGVGFALDLSGGDKQHRSPLNMQGAVPETVVITLENCVDFIYRLGENS